MIVADCFIRHQERPPAGVGSLVGQSRETHLDLGRHRL